MSRAARLGRVDADVRARRQALAGLDTFLADQVMERGGMDLDEAVASYDLDARRAGWVDPRLTRRSVRKPDPNLHLRRMSTALDRARLGMTIGDVAHAAGINRRQLDISRRALPEMDRRLMRALGRR